MKKYNLLLALSAVLLLAGCNEVPSQSETNKPTEEPTVTPTEKPTEEVKPTPEPTEEPTVEPTEEPTVEPTEEPTVEPTEEPTPSFEDMKLSTHKEFIEAESDTLIKVRGIITGISSNQENVYLQDGKDGFIIHDINIGLDCKVGEKYELGGVKGFYKGAHQLLDVTYKKALTDDIKYEINDISSTNFIDYDTMLSYQGSMVTLKGAMFKSIPDFQEYTKSYFNAIVSLNDKDLQINVSQSNIGEVNYTKAKTYFSELPVGKALDIVGPMSAFGHRFPFSPQINLLSLDDISFATLPSDTMVDNALTTLYVPQTIKSGETKINLPSKIEGYDVNFTWTSDNESIIKNDGTIIQPNDDTIVNLQVKAQAGAIALEKSFTCNVIGSVEKGKLVYTETFTHANSTSEGMYGQSGIKQGYAPADATFTEGYTWYFNNALHGAGKSDHAYVVDENEKWCARVKPISAGEASGINTKFAIENLAYVDFYVASYGSFDSTVLTVSYSIDNGQTWVDTPVTFVTHSNVSYQRAYINQSEACLVKFSFNHENAKATSNIDYISFYTK